MTNQKKNKRNTLFIYSAIGVAFGLCFPVGAVVVESMLQDLSLSWFNVVLMHQNNKLLFMIDTAPVFLGIFAFIGGINMKKAESARLRMSATLSELEEKNETNQALVRQSEEALRSNQRLKMEIESAGADLADASNALSDVFHRVSEVGKGVSDETVSVSSHVQEAESISDLLVTRFTEFSEKTAEVASQMSQSHKDALAQSGDVTLLDSAITDLSKELTALMTVAREVSEVTEMIRRISENVKLLALNASIEAARAGEAGKGFGVVAVEIQKLSGQTDEATDSIADRIQTVTDGIDSAVERMKAIHDYSSALRQSNTGLSERIEYLQSSVRGVNDESAELEEQLQDHGQVMSRMAQLAMAMSEHALSLSESLESGAQALERTDQAIHILEKQKAGA